MDSVEEKELPVGIFACSSCGADLKYKPGTHFLNCDYCGAKNEIPQIEAEIEELDFHEFLSKKSESENTFVASFVKCNSCGASSTLEPNVTSASCPYCSNPLVVEQQHDEKVIQPKSLLPFKLDKNSAKDEFKKWVNKLWFAPNDLKKSILNFDHFKGIYIPYWTFDTNTHTNYFGQRGQYYYVNETYTANENGKSVTKTRRVRKTRWYPASGNVRKFFDDVLTVATKSLPEKYIYKLEPWDLQNLVPFEKSYLSGFITEKYQIELGEGFEIAKEITDAEIRNLVRRDIGGDEQRIISMNTNYSDITFKHLLLPVYVSAYRFKGKLFQFLVNGRTGEVQGQRPYSWIKITFAVLATLAVIGLAIFLFEKYEGK
uniref:DNA helicase PriA n=1 Tax=Flavobacterium sp. TaxID=239 RepID=UPI0040499BFA